MEAFKQKVDLVSPKPTPGFVEDFKQRMGSFQGPNPGMLRDKGIVGTAKAGIDDLSQRWNRAGTAVGGIVNQGAQAAGNVANKVLYGNHPPPAAAAPNLSQATPQVSENDRMLNMHMTPAPGGNFLPDQAIQRPARMAEQVLQHRGMADTVQPVRLNPGIDTRVNLGEGNYLQAPQASITPEKSEAMRAIPLHSTQEAVDRRAADAAVANQRYDDWRAQRAQSVGGMQRPVQQMQGPDYSGVIDQAVDTMNSSRPSGSFDRQIAWKHKVANASDVLGKIGGLQTAANQNVTQQNVAGMNNATDQQRIAAGQEEARQRTALGMGQLASEDQYRGAQAATGQVNAQNDAQKLANETAIKEDELKRRSLADAELAKAFEMQNTGWFGGIDPIAQAQANALRLSGLKYTDLVPAPKK